MINICSELYFTQDITGSENKGTFVAKFCFFARSICDNIIRYKFMSYLKMKCGICPLAKQKKNGHFKNIKAFLKLFV